MHHRDLRDDTGKLDVVILEVGTQNGYQILSGQIFGKVNAVASWLFDLAVKDAQRELGMLAEFLDHFKGYQS
jgi:hypothetical protein